MENKKLSQVASVGWLTEIYKDARKYKHQRWITVRELFRILNISDGSVNKIIKQRLQYSKGTSGTREKGWKRQCHFSRITPVHTWLLALWTPFRNWNGTLYQNRPYSPDLAPSDCHLLRLPKGASGRKRFCNNDEVIQDVQEWLLWQTKDFVLSGICKLPDRWRKFIANQGDYFYFSTVHVVTFTLFKTISCTYFKTHFQIHVY
jgi:hypothetical protein